MNDFILLIIGLTPGAVGIALGKLLNGDTAPEPLNNGLIKYFLYSSSALVLTELSGFAQPLQKTLAQSNNFTLWDIAVPAGVAALLALVWKLFLKRAVIWTANKLLRVFGHVEITMPNYALENMLGDGQGHFVEIQMPDGKIFTGEVVEVNPVDGAITLRKLPEWINDDDVERYEKEVVIMLNTGVVIKEFAYQCKGPGS